MHLAGRCVGCGACERVCPSNVKIRYLAKDLADFCQELYGYRPGENPDEVPAMTSFDQDDKEVGFLGGESNDLCCDSKE
jgi:ferredoxin